MNVFKIIGLILAFLGRGAILAWYRRGIQYTTDLYLQIVGAGIIALGLAFGMNYLFMVNMWGGAQIALGFALPIIGLIVAFLPAIAVPVIGVTAGAADRTSIVAALTRYKEVLGLVIGWEGVYVFVTMAAPLYLSPAMFWVGHFPILIILGFLAAGKIHVNPDLYTWIFRVSIGVLSLILTMLIVFQQVVA